MFNLPCWYAPYVIGEGGPRETPVIPSREGRKKGSPPLAPDTFVKVQAEAVHDHVGAARFGGADADAVDALFGAPRARHAHTDFVIQFLDFATAQGGPIANGLLCKDFGTRHKHPDFKNFCTSGRGGSLPIKFGNDI